MSCSRSPVALTRFSTPNPGSAAKWCGGDYYCVLERKTPHCADMFVSIHADAFSRLSRELRCMRYRRGADEMGQWLAESENQSDLIGGVGNLADRDPAGWCSGISMDGVMRLSIDAGGACWRLWATQSVCTAVRRAADRRIFRRSCRDRLYFESGGSA